jgi:hypothetical protein
VQIAEFFASLGLKVNAGEWAKGEGVLSNVKKGLAAVGAAFGVAKIVGMINEITDLGGSLSDTSAAIGVAVEDLQELRFAAGLAGIGAGELDGAIRKYSRGLEEAKKGKGPVADAFRDLKISMDEIKGETVAQNLEVIAERFSKMEDGPKKTAIAMDLFGRSGSQLIPMLNEGQAGIAALRNEARELGIVIGEDAVGALDQFGDDMDRTKEALRGLKIQVVTSIREPRAHQRRAHHLRQGCGSRLQGARHRHPAGG